MCWLSYGLDDQSNVVRCPEEARAYVFTKTCKLALKPIQPPIQWVPVALSPGVKRSVPEADHSPITRAEIKNE